MPISPERNVHFRKAIYWARIGHQPQAVFHTHLGWFYIDRQRYADAIEAFEAALNEDMELFGNYWGIGRAKLEQGQRKEALDYLRIALDRAPEDFRPPASEEIPELLKRCEQLVNERTSFILD